MHVAAAARVGPGSRRRWDEAAGAYRERDLHGDDRITDTVADLFPLYAGVPDERQARRLVDDHLLHPTGSARRQTPLGGHDRRQVERCVCAAQLLARAGWINVNWCFVRGLERCGFGVEAEALRDLTLNLVARSGFVEYYEPTTGGPLGSREFSWSASLTLDLLRGVRR